MAVNWVMLAPQPQTDPSFMPLPNEKTIFTSSHRTSLSLTTPKSTYPAHTPNLTITSSDGTLHLTNQRIIYLPRPNSAISSNIPSFASFSCPFLNCHDTHLVMPWFGPNAWTAVVQPVAGGGLPDSTAGFELKFTFKEGWAPEFQGKFEAIKERLAQVVERARQVNSDRGGRGAVDLSEVHLEQLPSYADSGQDRVAPPASGDGEGQNREEERVVPVSATSEQVRAMAAAATTQWEQERVGRRLEGGGWGGEDGAW